MIQIFKTALAFALIWSAGSPSSAMGFSGYEPVPGSCRVESRANNWCHCDFVGAGNRGSGSISCSVLSCQHYKNFETDRACSFPHPSISCVFLNSTYAGGCIENIAVKAGADARSACESVNSCLQNPRCIQSYCNATTIRRGWVLDQVIEHP